MLRLISLTMVTFAITVPVHADDLQTCRDRNADRELRAAACEGLITAGQASSTDIGLAYSVRGYSLMKKRQYDRAIEAFDAAHTADPKYYDYINSRGIAYLNKGDVDHALADYNEALLMRPNSGNVLNNRGNIYLNKGDLTRALEDYNAALKSGNFAMAHVNRARALTANRDFDAAIADLDEALRLLPAWPMALQYRCNTDTAMGRFDDAIADCNAGLAKSPRSAFLLASRGNAYLGKGDLDAALADYNLALQINPNYVRAYAGRGQLFEKRGDAVAARYDYRAASAALSSYDDIDVSAARRLAQQRLSAMVAPPTVVPPVKPPGEKKAATEPPVPVTRKVALIVGNGGYKNVTPLENPPRDAKLIADTFRGLGFATVTLAPDLTRDKFFAALYEFGVAAETADWAVVYYAGHGMEIGGVNYLIPIDARLAADRDAETQAVALEQVIAAVSGARKLRLVMLDACRDNPFEKTMQRTIALKLVAKGFSNIEPEAGFMVVYAAKHGETALDGDSANSPFATVLARELKEPKVEIRKLFDIVRDDVWAATKHGQQPFTYGSPPGREDFYFVAGN